MCSTLFLRNRDIGGGSPVVHASCAPNVGETLDFTGCTPLHHFGTMFLASGEEAKNARRKRFGRGVCLSSTCGGKSFTHCPPNELASSPCDGPHPVRPLFCDLP